MLCRPRPRPPPSPPPHTHYHHTHTPPTGVDQLPEPLDSRVIKKELGRTFAAALRFGGLPLDFEVTGAERRLREALLRDGLEPKAGYRCVWWWCSVVGCVGGRLMTTQAIAASTVFRMQAARVVVLW